MAEQIRIEIRRAGAGNDQATPILIGAWGGSSVDSLDEPVPPADPSTGLHRPSGNLLSLGLMAMSNQTIFYTQIGSIVAFISSLFVLYRLLIQQKDATIEVLKEKNTWLQDRLETARLNSPDGFGRQAFETNFNTE
jgi:hypothetical protein